VKKGAINDTERIVLVFVTNYIYYIIVIIIDVIICYNVTNLSVLYQQIYIVDTKVIINYN